MTMAAIGRIERTVHKSLWLEDLSAIRAALVESPLTRSEILQLADEIALLLREGRQGRALNLATLAILADEDLLISAGKRRGFFRASRYDLKPTAAIFVASKLRDASDSLYLSESSSRYLRSVTALMGCARSASATQSRLGKAVRREGNAITAALLATLEFLFLDDPIHDHEASPGSLTHYTREDLAEAYSFLYYLYLKYGRGRPHHFALVDAKAASEGRFVPLLIDAAKIKRLHECEILIDGLGYECVKGPRPGEVSIRSPIPDLEKSITMGYIQHQHQRYVTQGDESFSDAVPLKAIGELLHKTLQARFIKLKFEPYARIVAEFPLVPEFAEALAENALFKEESMLAHMASREMFMAFPEFGRFEVVPGLTVWDLVKLHRLMDVIRWFVMSAVAPYRTTEPEIAHRSVVATFSDDNIKTVFEYVLAPQAAEAALNLLTWDPAGDQHVFDLQYQPLLRRGRFVALPINIVASMNSVRNALHLSRERIPDDVGSERLSEFVTVAVRDHVRFAKANTRYQCADLSGEIDVVIIVDNRLIAVECKNTLLPCNLPELRTSYDHLRKASQQLTRFCTAWTRPGFRQYLSAKLHTDLSSIDDVSTAILFSNRMFTGYRLEGHPVRAALEFVAFLVSGEISLASVPIATRPPGRVSSEDVRLYLEEDSVHRRFFDAMQVKRFSYSLGGATLTRETYALNVLDVGRSFGVDLSENAEVTPSRAQ